MAEGELAEREGRIDDAIASYVDLVRLSRATKNGGLALDALVARNIESMAIGGIAGLRDRLSSLQRGYLTAVLVDLDRQREDHQTVLERDIAWGQAVYGWRALLSDVLEQIEAKWNAVEKRFQRTEAGTRLLIVEFAIEDYKQEQGRLPRGLGDLKLDTDLLRDPFSPHGALLKYRLDHNDFLVYSVGADGDEDGGRPPEDGWIGDGDYQLDALYPSEAE